MHFRCMVAESPNIKCMFAGHKYVYQVYVSRKHKRQGHLCMKLMIQIHDSGNTNVPQVCAGREHMLQVLDCLQEAHTSVVCCWKHLRFILAGDTYFRSIFAGNLHFGRFFAGNTYFRTFRCTVYLAGKNILQGHVGNNTDVGSAYLSCFFGESTFLRCMFAGSTYFTLRKHTRFGYLFAGSTSFGVCLQEAHT